MRFVDLPGVVSAVGDDEPRDLAKIAVTFPEDLVISRVAGTAPGSEPFRNGNTCKIKVRLIFVCRKANLLL